MRFQHSGEIWRDFPELVPGVLLVEGINPDVSAGLFVAKYTALATSRLAEAPESEFPEIKAWRRTFARMGLKPTQYRCAAESLLRRLRKEGALPSLHPLSSTCATPSRWPSPSRSPSSTSPRSREISRCGTRPAMRIT
jgi:DNA/RNA-binding domain of Phe-tRNA-synthetase-like protein